MPFYDKINQAISALNTDNNQSSEALTCSMISSGPDIADYKGCAKSRDYEATGLSECQGIKASLLRTELINGNTTFMTCKIYCLRTIRYSICQ